MSAPLAGLLALALSATPSPEVRPTFRAAVIVGVNEPFEPTQPTLRYADDDAARFFELVVNSSDAVELLTVLDADSQRLFPDVAPRAHVPTHAKLSLALARVSEAGRRARAEGRRAELLFVYTGHGRTRGGEGEVKLAGGLLARAELAAEVLASTAFDRTHVVVDACNAYHLVNARGPDGASASVNAAFNRFVEARALERFPSVGLVLSTNGAGATHEWSRFRGGVFSHEVRSALAGAADADGDGRVDYVELEAFLASANLGVPEPQGRPGVYVRAPPIERGAALLGAAREGAPAIELPAALGGHFWLEDDRGLRFAEVNKAEGHRARLQLGRRARYVLVAHDGREVLRVEAPLRPVTVALPLAPRDRASLARGDDDGPPGLFTEAFGPRFADGFRARLDLASGGASLVDAGPSLQRVLGVTAGGLAVLALTGSVWQGRVAANRYDAYRATVIRSEVDALGGDVERARDRAIGLGVAAGVTAAVAVLCLLLE